MKLFSAPKLPETMINAHDMLPFSHDVKMIPAYFFFQRLFWKNFPVILILIPEVWTEEMKLFALHISYSTKLDLFIPFLTFLARIRICKFMRIRIRNPGRKLNFFSYYEFIQNLHFRL